MQLLVEPEWLEEHKADANVIILDASYPKVTGEKSPYEGVEIHGARRFDIDYFSDQASSLPHMLARATEFQEKARNLGLNQTSHLVIYDSFGIYSAPRAWWMFKVMGHDHVSVLNGGLPEWVEKGFEVEPTIMDSHTPGNFVATLQPNLVKVMKEISENISQKAFQVIDARSAGRFAGSAPEPRPELSSGHIPGSINISFPEVLDGRRFKEVEELRETFKITDQEKPLTFSCGSGLTACIIMLAARQVLENPMSIYDGSWTEWASNGGEIEKQF